MDAKFCAGLSEGDSANGVKLSMGITGGDFWARVGGCRNIYRSDGDGGVEEIDFSKVLAVCDIESNAIGISGVVHEAGKSYLYAVRSVNCAGFEEQSLGGLERVSFNQDGTIVGKTCNTVSDVTVDRTWESKVRISWRYCPINEQAKCVRFCVYSNGGDGEINLSEVTGSVDYSRRGVYTFESDRLDPGKWRFCVGAVSGSGYERMSPEIAVEIASIPITGGGSDIDSEVI
ncbi:MAG: hypothetical protein K9M75_10070 [Phycisphaerae bacterium]|nr:hypothetical protein [Phycisphaerae bacterium]